MQRHFKSLLLIKLNFLKKYKLPYARNVKKKVHTKSTANLFPFRKKKINIESKSQTQLLERTKLILIFLNTQNILYLNNEQIS